MALQNHVCLEKPTALIVFYPVKVLESGHNGLGESISENIHQQASISPSRISGTVHTVRLISRTIEVQARPHLWSQSVMVIILTGLCDMLSERT